MRPETAPEPKASFCSITTTSRWCETGTTIVSPPQEVLQISLHGQFLEDTEIAPVKEIPPFR